MGENTTDTHLIDRIASRHPLFSYRIRVVLVFADSSWLLYKAVQKTKTPDTSFVLSVRRHQTSSDWLFRAALWYSRKRSTSACNGMPVVGMINAALSLPLCHHPNSLVHIQVTGPLITISRSGSSLSTKSETRANRRRNTIWW